MSTRPPISEGGEHRADDGLVGRVVDEQEISQRLNRRRRMQVTAIEDMPWNMHEFALTGPAANTSETAEASRRRLPVMVIIAVGGDYLEPSFRVAAAAETGRSGPACCSWNHREVGVCFRCVVQLTKQKRSIQRTTRRGAPWSMLATAAVPRRVRRS